MARIDEVRERYESITEQLYQNKETFAEYLKFAGRFFKMPTAQTMTMFATNPKATMVADYDTWQRFGRQVQRGTNSIAVLDGSGLKHYFDISQTAGGRPPYQWTLDKQTAQEFIAAFSKAEGKEYKSMSGCVNAIGRTAAADNLENAIKALNISETDRAAFEKSFVSITQYFIAARCELGGRFDYKNNPMDLSAFDLVHSKAEAEKLTEYVQIAARPALLSMEKTINSLIAERSIDNGRGKTDLVRRGQDVLSRNQDGERQNVQAGSGNVRVSGAGGAGSDGRGTAAPERTDRPLGQGVAEIHDGELSGGDPVAGGSPEMGADSPSDRQGSVGDVGTSAEAVRREESSPENDVHRNRALGENTEFHSGTRGNGADSSSAQRINSTSAEDISPAVSVFVGLAAGALYENDLVRNAHQNTGRENFDVEVESAVTSYYTRLITGRENSEYSAEQLAPLYNRFQQDKDFRAEVVSAVTDQLDESLTSLEAARSKAAELGIPFSDRPYNSEEEYDPYAYDGSMSIEDSRKVADASNLHDFMLDYSDELEMAAASYNADEFRSYFAERAAEAVRSSHNEALTEMRENSEYLKSVADLVSDGLYNDIRSEIQQRNIKYPCVYVNGSHNRNFSPEEVGFKVNYPYSVEEFNAALNQANEIWNNDEKYLDSLHSVSVSVYASRTESSTYDVELYASYHSIGEIIDEKQSIASANILSKIKAAISEIENKPQDEIPDDVDKFYVNSEMENVTWIYYNPDSTAGGQFVCTYMSFDDIFDAMEQNDPLEYLTEHCGQELLDRGAEGFDGVAEEFMNDSEDISSRDSDYLSKLFALTEPRFAIFQLKDDEKLRDYRFSNSKYLKNHGMYIDRENYNRVYRGRLQENETLDDIYKRFNVDHPQDFRGHSLSVGDIVAVKKDGAITANFVDSFGFTEVPDFMLSREERKAQRTLTDNIILLAEKQLASDELDDLGNKLFDYDHAPVYSGITNWTMGASLSADEFEDLTTRFHNGEDISAELAKKIYANMQYLNFEYHPTDGISRVEISSEKTDTGMTFRTKGGFEVSHTWEALGNALITAAKQEFDRHEQLDREYFLHEAKARINEYSQNEFGEEADFSDLSHVPLAYTTHEDTGVGISVYADLENKKIVTMYGDKIAEEKDFRFADDMISVLGNLDFSELVELDDETVQKLTPKETAELSGRIEKYGLDIDFTQIDYIEVEVSSEKYIGGMDENGHERLDNVDKVQSSVLFYAASDNSSLLVYDGEKEQFDEPISLSDTLNRITEYLDLSRNSEDISVFVKPKVGERQYIDTASLEQHTETIKPQEEVTVPENSSGFTPGSDKTEGVQLNLFGEYVEENVPKKQSAPVHADTDSPLITQEMFDCVLRCGSSEPHSLERIINQYQLNKGAESNTEFLRNEFGTNARGIDFGQSTGAADRRITAWYDENGITIGLGDTALNSPAQKTITWEQAAERIEELLGDGKFADQVTIDDAEAYTRRKLAENLWYLSRDVEGDFFIPDEFFIGGFPESTERISEALKGEKPVSEFIAGMTDLIKRCEADKDVLRFPHRNLHEILESLKDLQLERREFRAEKNFEFSPVMFISEEEKDLLILSGSGVQGGKFRIENYFNQPHSSKEKADFLKNEYGTGGSGRTGYDTWHDAKGIVLNKGSFGGGEATVKMKWNEVAARIDRLISQKKYITQRDINNRIRSAQWTVDNSDDPQQIESAKKILAKYSASSTEPVKEPAARPVQVEAPVEKHDFTITDEHLGEGGQKAKFSANIAAIRTLKAIESENRLATPEEQTVLSKYVGWGGLSQAFDENNSSWSSEHKELVETLTEDEYTAAKSTVLNAHYTSPTVINGIYKGLAALGFSGGNVLEPAMGVGNFFGVMPEEMRKESRLHGVELDSITGRIAKQLYQTADIQIRGYEETTFSDNYFDAAIGNVPFGNYGVFDKRYNKENFLIHDYFFAKTLDKVAPNGIVAFVTTKGTLDKQNPKVREYLAKRADLVGAVRLPNNAFKANAGTEVTADIIFLQKREKMAVELPDWCYVGKNHDGIPVNNYFLDHPEMILGTMKQGMEFSMYGNADETACVPIEGADLSEQLEKAVSNLKLTNAIRKRTQETEKEAGVIPAVEDVRNFTFAEVDGKMYFRENNIMTEVTETGKKAERIKGLNELRATFREMLSAQERNCSDTELKSLQDRLNAQYDSFVKKNGCINDSSNSQVFSRDDDYNSLCALEIIDEEAKTVEKSDFFTKRTVKYTAEITHVDTPQEAMQVSIDTVGKMDIPYMAQLCGQEPQDIVEVLKSDNLIYLNPLKSDENDPFVGWEETSEYLSGNVREKLRAAELYAKDYPDFQRNVAALTEVLPKKLEAGDITARIGVSWVDVEDYQHFLEDYAKARFYEPMRRTVTGEYKIENKNWDTSAAATQIYGTARMPAKAIFENLLNNRDIVVKDKITDVDGKEHYEINKKQTDLAQDKALKMKDAFKRWLWEKPERREKYVERYNNLFNSIVGRKFDGSHQTFPGMSPSIRLKPHQLDAVMRAKFGGNTLLAHCVGAGKSFEMVAATMEKKRLGLINKACVVVPKHLVGQMANEWLRLYPQAKILTASEKDFDKDHRQKFIGRCCTGDYDAVIMSYEQFEKIPMSMEYRKNFIQHEIDAMQNGIDELNGDYRTRANNRSSIKDLEREKKRLETRLQKLIEGSGKAKDTSLTFEQLGFDSLVVDEAHNYKNGLVVSKMNRVSGVQTTPAQKSEDILMKTQYLNENYGEKNIIFATGTPVSNSMTELYIMQRYLRPSLLRNAGLQTFDDWASNFGEVVSKAELKPAGNGYRTKKRFAKFNNVPELMQMYKEFADIRTQDMLNLPVPEMDGGKPQTIVAKPNEVQTAYMQVLAERSEAIHSGAVDPSADNMLKITNEARLLGLDARCIVQNSENYPDSKVNLCVDKVMEIYQQTAEQKGVQAIFCDIAVNSDDGRFSVYDYIKEELVRRGIPENEICTAGDAETQKQRNEMYAQLRSGTKRIVLASTSKMGTGANIQTKLAALHNLDIPWKPSDIEQRNGRIIRQGNEFGKVGVYNYVTENTFDAYLMNIIVTKQRFISQLMSGNAAARSCEDVDEAVLNYSEMQALATGDERIKEKIELDGDVARLRLLENEHYNAQYRLDDTIANCQKWIHNYTVSIDAAKRDIEFAAAHKLGEDDFRAEIGGKTYTERKPAGEAIQKAAIKFMSEANSPSLCKPIGSFCDFELAIEKIHNGFTVGTGISLHRELTYTTDMDITGDIGNVTRLENLFSKGLDRKLADMTEKLSRMQTDLTEAVAAKGKPFEHAEELALKSARLEQLNRELEVGKAEDVIMNDEEEQERGAPVKTEEITKSAPKQKR